MQPTVSIIVPVYNAESTLPRCVDSILTQQYTDFELLLVDDGSTDSSGSLCDGYAAQDARVRAFHQENAGVSSARNLALDRARGTYLQFLDSDDWITADATRSLVRAAEAHRCDLVIADFYRVVGERLSRKGDIDEDAVLTREEYAAHMMENPADFYYGVLWNKLYRREIVEKHRLRMDPEISWCEDFMFNLEYMRHIETICVLRTPIYYYVKRKGSLVNQGMNISRVIRMKLMVFEYYNNFYKHVLDEEDYEKYRLQVYRFLVDSAGDGTVLPSILGRAKRLGEERTAVSREAVMEDSVLAERYRERKLFEYYLEPVAIKCNLPMVEMTLLFYVSGARRSYTRKELADLLNISRTRLRTALQRLSGRGMIRTAEVKEENGRKRQLEIFLQPAASLLEGDFQAVRRDYEEARFRGFDREELDAYRELSEKIRENVRRILKEPAKRAEKGSGEEPAGTRRK